MGPNGRLNHPEYTGSIRSVPCPEPTVVRVQQTATSSVPIHANIIHFVRRCFATGRSPGSPTATTEVCVKAGQSPQDFVLCENFLVEALDSGQGLFQFVSRKAHAASVDPSKAQSQERPIIDQLLDKWEQCGEQPGKLQLAGRYVVTAVERQPPQANHRRVLLTVRDIESDKIISVPLTQAGLKFTDRLLRWQEIETANTLLDEHQKCVEALAPGASLTAAGPMIISLAGIGRNAALITYREILARINAEPTTTRLDGQWLDDTLQDIVVSGRRDRGPGFLHSDAQLQALRAGFMEVIERRDQSSTLTQSRVQSARGQRLVQCQNSLEATRPRTTPDPTIDTAAPVPKAQRNQSTLRGDDRLQNEQRQRGTPAQKQSSPIEQHLISATQQETFKAKNVSNYAQFLLAESDYQRELTEQSVEFVLVPPSHTDPTQLIDDWSQYLAQTHKKQAISGNSHNGVQDDLCWLRSSWLSVFAMTLPSQLEARLASICNSPRYGAADAPILSAIAKIHQANPGAFMQGQLVLLDEGSLLDYAVPPHPAHLGPNMPLNGLLAIQFPTPRGKRQMLETPERFLRHLQCEIVTAYRPDVTLDPSFMDKIENLQRTDTTADSDLPVTLHRALGLPVLVIETGSSVTNGQHGEQINQSAQLRVAAPNGSKLANMAEKIAQQPGLKSTDVNTLLEQFRDVPVIWLDENHYSLYSPKVPLTTTQQAVQQLVSIAS